jgi:hypothetical protein
VAFAQQLLHRQEVIEVFRQLDGLQVELPELATLDQLTQLTVGQGFYGVQGRRIRSLPVGTIRWTLAVERGCLPVGQQVHAREALRVDAWRTAHQFSRRSFDVHMAAATRRDDVRPKPHALHRGSAVVAVKLHYENAMAGDDRPESGRILRVPQDDVGFGGALILVLEPLEWRVPPALTLVEHPRDEPQPMPIHPAHGQGNVRPISLGFAI